MGIPVAFVLFGILHICASANRSCKEIYGLNMKSTNGTYQLVNHKQQMYNVYCEFHKGYGYTYISSNTTVEININDLYTTRAKAKLRHVKTNGHQVETVVENLARYTTQYPLSFFYNKHDGHAEPINHATLGPYIYLGFLPASAANHVQPQGYRAGGKDFVFSNCDHNPNSYMAFYFNLQHHQNAGYINSCCESKLMHDWIDVSKELPPIDYMPPEYYFVYEMHMGGCGGYSISHAHNDVNGAALGLPFEFHDPCDSHPCQNGGSCYSENETEFFCECTANRSGQFCEKAGSGQGIIG